MKSGILFICTGNIFRSLTAELALRALMGQGSSLLVESAGIEARRQEMDPILKEALKKHSLDFSNHVQRKLIPEMLGGDLLPVAMGTDHYNFILSNFGVKTLLYREILDGQLEGILDVHEAVHDFQTNLSAKDIYIHNTVDFLIRSMPTFVQNVSRILDSPVTKK